MCMDILRVVAQIKVRSCNTFARAMAQVTCPTESSRLLVNAASKDSSTPRQQTSVFVPCPSSKHLCLPSKAAILILLWTVIVGVMYYYLVGISAGYVTSYSDSNEPSSVHTYMYVPIPYAVLALVMMFYPLSGFIADVCCGRLKTVVVSLLFLLLSLILWLLAFSVSAGLSKSHVTSDILNVFTEHGVAFFILNFVSLSAFIVGLVGYQANFIQLGLDQLFEAPSQYLAIFIHYAIWCFRIGSLLIFVNTFMLRCIKINIIVYIGAQVLVGSFVFLLLLLAGRWKREWFHNQPGHQSPYKTVYGVIKFAKNHKFPLQRSAFTYCYDYIPSRLDFAKERFGGPFTTEQVEDVKTFLRILLVLFAVGPVFALEMPGSYSIEPLFAEHFHHWTIEQDHCSGKAALELIVATACWIVLPVIVLFPLYIWIVFYLLRKRMLKLFVRLGVGIAICLLGVVYLLITDILGHATSTSDSSNHTLCVFQLSLLQSHPTLDLNWTVTIPQSVLFGVGPFLVIATTLEFISAQSPQSMKGLLVGVFFAIRGLFQFLNSIVIIPLSLKQPWAGAEMIEHPPVTNCGFVYLLLTSVTGLIGLILFTLAARRYTYRTRDEGMFQQHEVEEVYDRYITQVLTDNPSYGAVGD